MRTSKGVLPAGGAKAEQGQTLAENVVPELVTFARNLKFAREAARLSQQDLAERAKVARSHVSNLERGLINPSLATIADLARALDCQLIDFFHEPAGEAPVPEPIATNAVHSIVSLLRDAGFIDPAA